MVDFRIRVIVDPSGAVQGSRQANASINSIGTTASRVQQTVARLFAFAGAAEGTRRLVQLADTFTNIQNRLNTVTATTAQTAAVTQELFNVAQRTRTSFQATAEIYTRTALSVRNLGLSQRQVIRFTEALNQSTVLSGATAQEASNALIQLSQGIASGTLRGEELRSVLEQLPVAADVLAESLGVTRGELRLLGEQGRITSDQIINAFLEQAEELEERFGETVPTIGRAFEQLRNQLIRSVGNFDQVTGASQRLAQAIIQVSNNLEVIVRGVLLFANVLLVNLASRAIPAVITALRALTIAIATNPVGFIATALTLGISTLITFSDRLRLTADGAATLFDLIAVSAQALGRIITRVFTAAARAIGLLSDTAQQINFADILRATARGLDALIQGFQLAGISIQLVFTNLGAFIELTLINSVNAALDAIEDSINSVVTQINNTLGRVPGGLTLGLVDFDQLEVEGRARGAQFALNLVTEIAERIASGESVGIISQSLNELIEQAEERAIAAREAAAARERELQEALAQLEVPGQRRQGTAADFTREIEQLQRRITLARAEASERALVSEVIRIEDALRRELTATERAQAEATINQVLAAERQREILDELRGPQDAYNQRLVTLNQLLQDNAISQAEFNRLLNESQLQLLEDTESTTFLEGFRNQIQILALETQAAFAEVGQSIGSIFGPGGTLQSGLADAITQSLLWGDSFTESLRNIGRTIVTQVISSLIRLGIQFGLTALIARTVGRTATVGAAAEAGALAAAWAPAASFASLATLGANAAPAAAAIAGTNALSQGIALASNFGGAFQNGGLVSGGRQFIQVNEAGEEFVMRASAVRRIGLPTLQALNDNRPAPQSRSSSSVIIAEGAIQINASDGQSADDLARAFGDELDRRIDERIQDQQRVGGTLFGTGSV